VGVTSRYYGENVFANRVRKMVWERDWTRDILVSFPDDISLWQNEKSGSEAIFEFGLTEIRIFPCHQA